MIWLNTILEVTVPGFRSVWEFVFFRPELPEFIKTLASRVETHAFVICSGFMLILHFALILSVYRLATWLKQGSRPTGMYNVCKPRRVWNYGWCSDNYDVYCCKISTSVWDLRTGYSCHAANQRPIKTFYKGTIIRRYNLRCSSIRV